MALFDLWKMTDAPEAYSLKKALVSQAYLTEAPKWNGSRCVCGKLDSAPCSLCHQVCPMEVYPENLRTKLPNYSPCIQCGMCMAVCPDRCIAPPAAQAEQILKLSCKNDKPLSCAQQGGKLPCLAAMSWERMAALALEDGLALNIANCAQCEDSLLQQQVQTRLEELRFFLGDSLFEEKVQLSEEADNSPEPPEDRLSRRELFRAFVELPVSGTPVSLPTLENRQDNGLIYRAMLRDRIRSNATGLERSQLPRFRVRLPIFTEDCYNCGSCAWKCPQKALKLQNENDSILVTIEVWRCTGCGLCQTACKTNAISGMGTMRVPYLGKTALKRIPAYLCADCGHPRPRDAEEGVCAACLGKRKMNRIRTQREAERREKAKKQE